MEALCDRHLTRLLECCGASMAVGIGNFAAERLRVILPGGTVQVAKILHPSPASPAANRDWAGTAARELQRAGVW
jgi:single-strand selective monofunctional uracil DNA glycosylase